MNPAIRFGAVAIVALVLVGGAVLVLRPATNVGPSLPTNSPAPTSTDHVVTLAEYRAARDAVCTPAINQVIALNAAAESFHPDTTPGDAGLLADNIEQVIAVASAETNALAGLTPPPTLVAEHAVDVARHRDGIAIIGEVVARLRAGDIAGANAIDAATTSISREEEAYEQKYGLAGCP